jgi:hypothetical protein
MSAYGDETIFNGGIPAIFDTSTALIYMPEEDV